MQMLLKYEQIWIIILVLLTRHWSCDEFANQIEWHFPSSHVEFLAQHRNALIQMVWQRYFLTDLLTLFVITFKVGTNIQYIQQAKRPEPLVCQLRDKLHQVLPNFFGPRPHLKPKLLGSVHFKSAEQIVILTTSVVARSLMFISKLRIASYPFIISLCHSLYISIFSRNHICLSKSAMSAMFFKRQ